MRKHLAAAIGFTLMLPALPATAGNGPACTAVVQSSGTLARGYKAKSVKRLKTGTYVVNFRQDVTACAYSAAIGLSGTSGESPFGSVNAVERAGNPNAIVVQTFDTTGTKADLGFHVIVNC